MSMQITSTEGFRIEQADPSVGIWSDYWVHDACYMDDSTTTEIRIASEVHEDRTEDYYEVLCDCGAKIVVMYPDYLPPDVPDYDPEEDVSYDEPAAFISPSDWPGHSSDW